MRYAAFLVALALAACNSAQTNVTPARGSAGVLRPGLDPSVLRVVVDDRRERIWILGLEHLDVHDKSTKKLIRRIVLPQWTVADFVCEPDIALDSAGAAYISHNLEARLWQVDSATLELTELALRLPGREHLDIGLGKLAFARDGTLFGIASTGGSLWRIEIGSATARAVQVDAPASVDCAI